MIEKNEYLTSLLPQYLDGVLSSEQQLQVEQHLKNSSAFRDELAEYKTLLKAFGAEKTSTPSKKLETTFLEQLEAEKLDYEKIIPLNSISKKPSYFKNFLKIAASIVLLIGSFLMGKYQQSEKTNKDIAALEIEANAIKQTAMLSLLENTSASKRIQGVNFIENFTNPDEEIVVALIDRLFHDENINVRMTAVEALSKFSKLEIVKTAFIKALETVKDPSLQIILIQYLVQIQERKAAAPMKKLLEHEDTQPFIKEEIKRILPNII